MLRSTGARISALVFAGVLTQGAYAVDGVVLIDQARALAGNVTPGDAPGFPVTISVRGSYRLSGNLTIPNADTTAIEIAVDFVTIDLNGFSIVGNVDCSGGANPCAGSAIDSAGAGIKAGDYATSKVFFNITIRNGTIQGMGGSGVYLSGDSILVEDVKVRSNGAMGMWIQRPGATQNSVIVRHCNIQLNGAHGLRVDNALITDNVISQNRLRGLQQLSNTGGTNVIGNVITFNNGGVSGSAGLLGFTNNVLACNPTCP